VAAEPPPVVLPDVEHADVLNPLIRRRESPVSAGVPLVFDGRPIGVLHVGTLQRRDFTRDEVDLLQLAADRVAIAVSHARAFESERAARRRIEDVQAIVDAGLAHLELDALLNELLDRIRTILGVDTCAVLLVDPERRDLVARAAIGIEEEVEQGVRIPLGKGFAGRIAAEGRPIGLPDVDHADVYNPLLREKGIKSCSACRSRSASTSSASSTSAR
jgi:GAF domain-containing protein